VRRAAAAETTGLGALTATGEQRAKDVLLAVEAAAVREGDRDGPRRGDRGVNYWTGLRRASNCREEMGKIGSSMECRCAVTGGPGLSTPSEKRRRGTLSAGDAHLGRLVVGQAGSTGRAGGIAITMVCVGCRSKDPECSSRLEQSARSCGRALVLRWTREVTRRAQRQGGV